MTRYLLLRIAGGLVMAFAVSVVVLALAPLAANQDPASIVAGSSASGAVATEAELAATRHRLGLDLPFPERYLQWLAGVVHGDLGRSLLRDEGVSGAILAALPVTLSIAFGATVVMLLLALPAGAYAAMHPGSWLERVVLALSGIGIAMPNFVVGLVLVRLLSLQLDLLPSIGFTTLTLDPVDWLRHTTLPSLALGVPLAAQLARYVRAAVADILQRDYVRTAVGKGLPSRMVVWKHALKNAMIPVITVVGLEIRTLLGGTVAVETIFALPGLGTLTLRSVLRGDYPMIEGIVLLTVAMVIFLNLLVDLSYVYFNPRLRLA